LKASDFSASSASAEAVCPNTPYWYKNCRRCCQAFSGILRQQGWRVITSSGFKAATAHRRARPAYGLWEGQQQKCCSVFFLLTGRLQFWYLGSVSKSGNNSVVECNLAKVEVASSNLVSRST
jgi:hypothetical protein